MAPQQTPSRHHAAAQRRHTARPLPSRIPSKSAHSGTRAEAPAKSTAYKVAASRARRTSFFRQLLCDRVKCPPHFFEHHGKFQSQHRLFRIDHHIHRAAFKRRTPQPHRFAQPPLDPVALDRAAQHASHREPDARGPPLGRPLPAADRTRSCARKSAAAPACRRARSRSASATAPRAGSLLPPGPRTALHSAAERRRSPAHNPARNPVNK